MKTYSEYKTAARGALNGNWGMAALSALIYSAITGATVGFPGLGFFFITLPLTVGYAGTFRRLVTDGDTKLVDNLFEISINNYLHQMATMALRSIYTFLWTLLLIVPGIIKALQYSMAPYIAIEHPELSAGETLTLSRQMTKDHLFDIFWLGLSFIGWLLLGILTLFIGYLWLQPYMYTAFAAFYGDLKAEYLVGRSEA